jgi:hypothetical protein
MAARFRVAIFTEQLQQLTLLAWWLANWKFPNSASRDFFGDLCGAYFAATSR